MRRSSSLIAKAFTFRSFRCPKTLFPRSESFPLRQSTISLCSYVLTASLGIPKPSFSAQFATLTGTILVQARDPSEVAVWITDAIDGGRLDDAWRLYEQSLIVDGQPGKSTLGRLLVGLTESLDAQWLRRACQVVESVVEGKKVYLLEKEILLYLSFILARCGLPVSAAAILRKLVEIEEYPQVAVWTAVIAHMAKTSEGAFLAAEILGEFGYLFKDHRIDPRKKSNRSLLSMKPNPEAFNVALIGCLVYGLTKKAEQLIELMPRVGVKENADLLIVMAYIYERNGCLDEIKKLKRHVVENVDVGALQLQQFYECLLSCHLKLNDLECASGIVLGMLRKAREAKNSFAAAASVLGVAESCQASAVHRISGSTVVDLPTHFRWITGDPPSFQEFCKNGNINVSRLAGETKELLLCLHHKLQNQLELVKFDYGILHPTDRLYAKLVRSFLEAGKTTELAQFLIKVNMEEAPTSNENSLVVQAIMACISMNLLEQAHDLLDEMTFNQVRISSSVYSELLKAYCQANKIGEITALLKDARKAGVQLDSSCYKALIQLRAHHDIDAALHLFSEMNNLGILRSSQGDFAKLVEGCEGDAEGWILSTLLEEIKDVKKVDYGVHDWNGVISLFCKKRLMHDAKKALKKMMELGYFPNSQTFHSLVTAYAAIGGKYVEVAELWGEMKALMNNTSSLKFDQELLDSLLYCFVRGGFFIRANEVVAMMEKEGMFIDKYKYRTLWLKYHRKLYKGKASKIQTEAQIERREAALSFKRWLNLT